MMLRIFVMALLPVFAYCDSHMPEDEFRQHELFRINAGLTKNFEYDGHLWICFRGGNDGRVHDFTQIVHHPDCWCQRDVVKN